MRDTGACRSPCTHGCCHCLAVKKNCWAVMAMDAFQQRAQLLAGTYKHKNLEYRAVYALHAPSSVRRNDPLRSMVTAAALSAGVVAHPCHSVWTCLIADIHAAVTSRITRNILWWRIAAQYAGVHKLCAFASRAATRVRSQCGSCAKCRLQTLFQSNRHAFTALKCHANPKLPFLLLHVHHHSDTVAELSGAVLYSGPARTNARGVHQAYILMATARLARVAGTLCAVLCLRPGCVASMPVSCALAAAPTAGTRGACSKTNASNVLSLVSSS
jgi:hypothetical protein